MTHFTVALIRTFMFSLGILARIRLLKTPTVLRWTRSSFHILALTSYGLLNKEMT